MADYYPLIARAIAALDPNAPGESRRALYERARTALIAQLRRVQPPLSESAITRARPPLSESESARERLSLEEPVRKVESEAAQRAREASRPGGGARSSGSGDACPSSSTRATEGNAPAPQAAAPPPPRAPRPRPRAPARRAPVRLRRRAAPTGPPSTSMTRAPRRVCHAPRS